LIKERKERKFPSRRSTLGSTGVLRDAIANRGLSISECDLRLANQRKEEPKAPETLKRNRSFSFPDNMKEIFGKNNVSENLSSEGGQTSVNIPSSRPLRPRSFSDSPDPSNMVAGSKRLLNLREFRGSLPSICITPSASDAEYSPALARKRGSSLGDVENTGGNQCRNLNVNSRSQEKATEEEEKENGKHQPQGIVKEDDVMYQRKIVPCNSEISLKDFPAMDTRLMDETRVLEVVMNTEVQSGGSSGK